MLREIMVSSVFFFLPITLYFFRGCKNEKEYYFEHLFSLDRFFFLRQVGRRILQKLDSIIYLKEDGKKLSWRIDTANGLFETSNPLSGSTFAAHYA